MHGHLGLPYGWQRVRRQTNSTPLTTHSLFYTVRQTVQVAHSSGQSNHGAAILLSKAKKNKAEEFRTFAFPLGGQKRRTSQVFWISGFLEQIRCYKKIGLSSPAAEIHHTQFIFQLHCGLLLRLEASRADILSSSSAGLSTFHCNSK